MHLRDLHLLGALAACLSAAPTLAAPPGADIGVLRYEDIAVVTPSLYPTAGALEVGARLGLLPLDPWVVSGSLGLDGAWHLSDVLSFGLTLTGMKSRPTAQSESLSELSGVTVDGWSPLFSAQAEVRYAPLYGKVALAGRTLAHYRTHAALGAGVFLARRTVLIGVDSGDLEGSWNLPASLGFGLGQTFYLRPGEALQAIHLDARDQIFFSRSTDGQTWPKHNVALTVGWGMFFGGGKG